MAWRTMRLGCIDDRKGVKRLGDRLWRIRRRRNGRCSSPPCRHRRGSVGSARLVVLGLLRPVPAGRAVCPGEARRGLGLHPELPVGASGQRPDHRDPAVRAVRHPRLAGAARSRGRLSVRGPHVGAPRAQLPAPVRAGRPDRCRTADHRLAVHDLARRLPARRDRLRIVARRRARATSRLAVAVTCAIVLAVGLRRGPAHHRRATNCSRPSCAATAIRRCCRSSPAWSGR